MIKIFSIATCLQFLCLYKLTLQTIIDFPGNQCYRNVSKLQNRNSPENFTSKLAVFHRVTVVAFLMLQNECSFHHHHLKIYVHNLMFILMNEKIYKLKHILKMRLLILIHFTCITDHSTHMYTSITCILTFMYLAHFLYLVK